MCLKKLAITIKAHPEPVELVGEVNADEFEDFKDGYDDMLVLRNIKQNPLGYERHICPRQQILRIVGVEE